MQELEQPLGLLPHRRAHVGGRLPCLKIFVRDHTASGPGLAQLLRAEKDKMRCTDEVADASTKSQCGLGHASNQLIAQSEFQPFVLGLIGHRQVATPSHEVHDPATWNGAGKRQLAFQTQLGEGTLPEGRRAAEVRSVGVLLIIQLGLQLIQTFDGAALYSPHKVPRKRQTEQQGLRNRATGCLDKCHAEDTAATTVDRLALLGFRKLAGRRLCRHRHQCARSGKLPEALGICGRAAELIEEFSAKAASILSGLVREPHFERPVQLHWGGTHHLRDPRTEDVLPVHGHDKTGLRLLCLLNHLDA
mmetsp:Transcript_66876/g.150232  ORF Transcript_66876/g.150232 Transcript_66876/m.150232 type:complete len:304 (+) Transcript_66876:331-1242(+)